MSSSFYTGGAVPPALVSTHFHGRARARLDLARAVTRGRPPQRLVLGPHGRGKSTLANAVLHDLAGRPHLGVDLARVTPANPWGVLARFAGPWGPDWAERVATLRSRGEWVDLIPEFSRKAPRTNPPLVVLDNADALEDLPRDFARAWTDELRRMRKMPLLILAARPIAVLADFEPMELDPFPPDEARALLESRWAKAGVQAGAEVVESVLGFAQGEPDLLQRLGHRLWEAAKAEGRSVLTLDDVAEGVSHLLESLPPDRAALYGSVAGQSLDLLAAMAVHGDEDPTTLARRVDIEPKNAVVLLSRTARRTGLVERRRRGAYGFRDPLFGAYLKKRYATAAF